MQLLRLTALSLFIASIIPAYAETIHGIEALDTLGDIKAKYPNATIVRVKAAWVTEGEDFFRLEGPGFPGKLFLAFKDSRPHYRTQLANKAASESETAASAIPTPSTLEKLASQPDEVALSINWVRWVPQAAIPFERYKSKYGEPSKCDFKEDTMEPYCEWESRGLLANLSDDKKLVGYVEANFTEGDQRAAWKKKFGFIPQWLVEEQKSAPPTKKKQDAKKPTQIKPAS